MHQEYPPPQSQKRRHKHIAMRLEVFLGGVWRTGAGELSVGVRGDNMLQFRPASKGKSEKFFFKSGQSTFHCIRSIQDRLQRAGRAKDPRYDAVHCGKPGLRCTMHCGWVQRPVVGRWLDNHRDLSIGFGCEIRLRSIGRSGPICRYY